MRTRNAIAALAALCLQVCNVFAESSSLARPLEQAAATQPATKLPHVKECNYCFKCHVTEHQTQELGFAVEDPKSLGYRGQWRRLQGRSGIDAEDFALPTEELKPKSSLPNCTECVGCNTQLQLLRGETKLLGHKFMVEGGNTANWLFSASTTFTNSGSAVAKVFCMPFTKRQGAKMTFCTPQKVLHRMRLLMAMQSISEDCGFKDVVPRVWFAHVSAVLPDTVPEHAGFHVRWMALWMERVPGVSLENFLTGGLAPRMSEDVKLEVMQARVNGTQVVHAAVFDLLTSQCDRHAQNIMIDGKAGLHLIDNEACLKALWEKCAFNSVFLPTTQKFNIVRLGNAYVLKQPRAMEPVGSFVSLQVLLDYRCYVNGGLIGTHYPPRVKECLADMAKMQTPQLLYRYFLPSTYAATNLQTRAKAMLEKGFEEAMKHSEPANPPARTYRMQPPCCRLTVQSGRFTRCATPWSPILELPKGDPNTGREWTKDRPDPGTYVGGTVF